MLSKQEVRARALKNRNVFPDQLFVVTQHDGDAGYFYASEALDMNVAQEVAVYTKVRVGLLKVTKELV